MKFQEQAPDELDNQIIGVIRDTPGIRFTEISERLNLPPTTAYSRIMRLKRMGYLKTNRGAQSLKIYPAGVPGQ
jgi:DNA-binding IclR family transcriptional regulator